MRSVRFIVLKLLVAAGILISFGTRAADSHNFSETNKVAQIALYQVKDDKGQVLQLFSPEAYRAEFRYLRKVFLKTDLTAPAIQTDGWTYNISEAEWPFMGFCYLGYASADLAKHDPTIREEALAEMRWLIGALQTPRMSGFVAPHFGEPFGSNQIHVAVFVHGHFLNLALRYREVSRDARYDALIHRVAKALVNEYARTDEGVLRSYRDMWWLTDNFPAVSALSRYDRIFHRDTSAARLKFLRSLKTWCLDKDTGLYCTYVNPTGRALNQGPRGISVMYGLHFLKDFDPAFAEQQYALAKQYLVENMLGFSVVREFPKGASGRGDIDSGPVILGAGPSASGFAIAAAAINGDKDVAWRLLKASAMVGMPVFHDGELQYASMPTVGQAVILFGKTELWQTDPP